MSIPNSETIKRNAGYIERSIQMHNFMRQAIAQDNINNYYNNNKNNINNINSK